MRDWRDRAAASADAPRQQLPRAAAADRLLDDWRSRPPGSPLSEPQSKELLAAYGIRLPQERPARSPDEAARHADTIGYPVVVKAIASRLTHKSDAGAVVLGLGTAAAVCAACEQIRTSVAAYDPTIEIEGFLVAQSISGGLELVLGIQNDPEMGPMVMFGSGGVLLELLEDVAFAPPGLGRREAEAMIARTRAAALLAGYRGRPGGDIEAVIDAIVATGRIAADLGARLQSLDVNPLVALPLGRGAWALDALVVLGDDLGKDLGTST